MNDINSISIALSGGGVRAMVFHCGVLRFLAEKKKLEYINHISSVSGGSLLVGLILSLNSMKWPSSKSYLQDIEPKIKSIITSTDLQNRAIINLLSPFNWRFILSRANVVSKTIRQLWGVNGNVNDLPEKPIWSVNGTTAETGKRFRFKGGTCGDYLIGYIDSTHFYLSDVMAVSAAFPIGIGPFSIKSEEFENNNKSESSLNGFDVFHIYDGVYMIIWAWSLFLIWVLNH